MEQEERRIGHDALIRRIILNPYNWVRLLSPRFDRSDLAAEYYDNYIFEHSSDVFQAAPDLVQAFSQRGGRLKATAREILRQSPEYQMLLNDLKQEPGHK